MIDERTLRYDFWANAETLDSLERASSPPARAVAVMAHLVATLFLWHGRARKLDHAIPVWPEWTLQEVRRRLVQAEPLWQEIVHAGENEPAVSYRNSKGESFVSTLHDIATHVMFHGAYHRGQIATMLREAGFEPAYTDFIHAARNNRV